MTGLSDDSAALLVITSDFQSDENLDLADSPGDPDRRVTFVPTSTRYYYVEVSKAPGADVPYSLSFREGS